MKVQGTQTIKETRNVDVEINPKEVLRKIWWESTTKPEGAEYIRDGYWYIHDYFDYHKRYDVEKKDREATTEELSLYNAYLLLVKNYKGTT